MGEFFMDVFKFGLSHWKKYLPAAILVQLISFAALTADLMIPMISEMFIDYVICKNVPDGRGIFSFLLEGNYGEVQSFTLFRSLTVLLMLFLSLRISFVYGKNVWHEKLGLKLETDLRMKTFDKLLTLDSALIGEYNTGELLTILNADTIMFKDLFSRILPLILDSVFVLLASALFLAGIHPWLLVFPVCLTPVFAAALIKFRKLALHAYGVARENISAMNLTVQENIEAVRLVRSFTNESLEEEKFDRANGKLKDSCVSLAKLLASFDVAFSSIKQLAYVGSVGLTLEGERILKDISVSIPYGKKLGIAGETGSGKAGGYSGKTRPGP